ncbi:MAG: LysM peptidoglycan-binding domain-containing protein [Chloroflexota bacterium]|nr:LysM peptidoglycan-binding domain-containing protein [Chloroflexota bacterium]
MRALPRKICCLAITIAVLLWGVSSASTEDDWYTVQTGDSIESIAAHFQVSVEALLEHNNLSDGEFLARGRILRIPPPEMQLLSYQVGPDDSIPAIAARFGVTAADLMRVNNIQQESHLIPGQTLYLPGDARDGFEGSHVVQPGEALNKIAGSYGLDWRTLAMVNNLSNPNRIYAGQVLKVPAFEDPAVDTAIPEVAAEIPVSTTVPTVVPTPARAFPNLLYRIRVAQPGDTIEGLAQRHAAPLQELLDLNHLRGESRLYAGEIIVLPLATGLSGSPRELPADAQSHVVRRGETLGSIANLYGRDIWDIAAANGLLNPNLIYVGQVLIIQ